MPEIDLKNRTKNFAHRCVKPALSLNHGSLSKHIQNQLIRSATFIASNYRAACLARSKAEFVSKISISLEEADETCFWMEFIADEKLINKKKREKLLAEGKELTAILIKSRKTVKNRASEFNEKF